MELHFTKCHGTGNDFILVDDRNGVFPHPPEPLVQRLCDRHFGIGSDGLILLQPRRNESTDFHMEFFNPDASRSFCGNGSRCAFAFWSALQGGSGSASFTAIDGVHHGTWVGEEVAVSLPSVRAVQRGVDGPEVDFIHTGSPHELVWVEDVEAVAIMVEGPHRRYSERHGEDGSNINFVQRSGEGLRMRTYERGVEAETLSCGSGVVAAALSGIARGLVKTPVIVNAPGGQLRVEAIMELGNGSSSIQLIGPVATVFRGTVLI